MRKVIVSGLICLVNVACNSNTTSPVDSAQDTPADSTSEWGQDSLGDSPANADAATDTVCSPGTLRCACYGNNSCNAGLTCYSDVCVVVPDVGVAPDTAPETAPETAPVDSNTPTDTAPETGAYVPASAQSCNGLPANCGEDGTDSCCTTIVVPGGETFNDGVWSATVSTFALDKYEVTVGRFRQFVNAYDAWIAAGNPTANAGYNPNVVGDGGVGGGTGWNTSWNASDAGAGLFPSAAALVGSLQCNSASLSDPSGYQYQTWTASPGLNETEAANCINWFAAFAFCIWDGGRLPTEAEWEYAATGGNYDYKYPWGSDLATCSLANFLSGTAPCAPEGVAPVGSYPNGAARWGHEDLAGNVWEWVFDWYGTYPATAVNYANATPGAARVLRGGSFFWALNYLSVSYRRNVDDPEASMMDAGFRCARTP